jgi:hypothetical protein
MGAIRNESHYRSAASDARTGVEWLTLPLGIAVAVLRPSRGQVHSTALKEYHRITPFLA